MRFRGSFSGMMAPVLMTCVAACAQTQPAATTTADPGIRGSHGPGMPDTAVSVPIQPVTYGDSSPCAPVTTTLTRLQAPAACQTLWRPFDATYVPGQDLMTTVPMPKSVSVAGTVKPSDGAAAGTAYFRTTALSTWAIPFSEKKVIAAIDTPQYANRDPVLTLMNQDVYVGTIPPCGYPNSITVTTVDAAVLSFLHTNGWPEASSSAIVATFPACPGVLVRYPHRAASTADPPQMRFAQATQARAVVTGSIRNISPLGLLWVVDGYQVCGPDAMRTACR